MAYVVSKPNGNWEVRESFRTGNGPRSRTLASFRELTPEIEKRIASRSSVPLDIEDLREKARQSGATVRTEADRLAGKLLRMATRGELPSKHLRTLLRDELAGDEGLPHEIDRMKAWAGASPQERNKALVELLGVGDALPASQTSGKALRFPPIRSDR